jgi:hypothetical protein
MDPGRVRTGIKWSRIQLMVWVPASTVTNLRVQYKERNLGSLTTIVFSPTTMCHEISSLVQEKINFSGYICRKFDQLNLGQ